MTYMNYTDAATGKTLVCCPGETYEIIVASGHSTPPVPNDGRFTEVVPEEKPDDTPGSKSRRGVTEQDTLTPEAGE